MTTRLSNRDALPAQSEASVFDACCRAHGLPPPEREYVFAPPRKWRFDYYWPDAKVALEVEGLGGRHQRIGGFLKDMEKYNEAAIMGIAVIRCTTRDLNTGNAFQLVRRACDMAFRSLTGTIS